MNKAVSTLTAATAGVGLVVASTAAKAFVIAPAVAAVALAGGIVGGAMLGSAVANPTVVAPAPVAVAPGPSVTVNSTTCYYARKRINHERTRVRVCDGPAGRTVMAAPLAAAAPIEAPAYAYYGYEAIPAVIAPPGHCDVIAGNRVCFQ